MEGHRREQSGNRHDRSHAWTQEKPSWKVTDVNKAETVMEGHMREQSGNRHGRSHA